MRKLFFFICTVLLIITIAAFSSGATDLATQVSTVQNTTTTLSTAVPASTVENGLTASMTAENSVDHEDAADYVWDSSAEIPIALNGDSITANAKGGQRGWQHVNGYFRWDLQPERLF